MCLAYTSNAQSSVWNNAKSIKKEKREKASNKLKAYKDHLQHWGIDTNYDRGLLIGGKANTNGWSGCVYYLRKRSNKATDIWLLSFSEIKHEKQLKQQGNNKLYPELGNATPYIFGKINNLYTLQIGYGRQKLLLPNVVEGNLSLSIRYSGGLSLAMLKPYYLKLVYIDYSLPNEPAVLKEEKYTEANSETFLNSGKIRGAAHWDKGLDEIDYVPGAFAEFAFVIEPAKNKTFVQAITLGANVSFYSKDLAIMANQQAYPWQACLFAGIALGKRWK